MLRAKCRTGGLETRVAGWILVVTPASWPDHWEVRGFRVYTLLALAQLFESCVLISLVCVVRWRLWGAPNCRQDVQEWSAWVALWLAMTMGRVGVCGALGG